MGCLKPIFLITTCLIGLTGCPSVSSTRTLGALQSEMSDIVRTQAQCKINPNVADNLVCFADFKANYAYLEGEALDAVAKLKGSQDQGDQQVAIGLYRVAAFASLESESGEAHHHADKGATLCDAMGDAMPPRDCALLGVAGQYQLVNSFLSDVGCIKNEAADCGEDKATEVIGGFCGEVYRPLQEKTARAKGVALMPPSALPYFDRQITATKEGLQTLQSFLTRNVPGGDRPDACQCLTDPGTANCENFSDLQIQITCISDAIDGSGNCPAGL